jgi:hypothetical protein
VVDKSGPPAWKQITYMVPGIREGPHYSSCYSPATQRIFAQMNATATISIPSSHSSPISHPNETAPVNPKCSKGLEIVLPTRTLNGLKGLSKTWTEYKIAKRKGENDKLKYYVSGIQRLQQELIDAGIASPQSLSEFPDIDFDRK